MRNNTTPSICLHVPCPEPCMMPLLIMYRTEFHHSRGKQPISSPSSSTCSPWLKCAPFRAGVASAAAILQASSALGVHF